MEGSLNGSHQPRIRYFADARGVHGEALWLLVAGDLRDAAEKTGWSSFCYPLKAFFVYDGGDFSIRGRGYGGADGFGGGFQRGGEGYGRRENLGYGRAV